jgi:hypothetical protein
MNKIYKYFIKFQFKIVSTLVFLYITLIFKTLISSIFIILSFYPSFFMNLLLNCILFFVFVSPAKKKITFFFERQKELMLNPPFISCGGLVSFFKIHGNNINDFENLLRDIPRARELIHKDKLFLENKNNSVNDQCTLLREARLMEIALEGTTTRRLWNNLVKCTSKSWGLADSSGNTNSIYNLFLEKQVFDGASTFFLSRQLPLTYLQKNIPEYFRKQLTTDKKQTPDIIAVKSNNATLVNENIYDVKVLISNSSTLISVERKPWPKFSYNLIYHGLDPYTTVTPRILNHRSSISNGVLLYCPKLNTILEAKTEISPITQVYTQGWYNFESGVFKPFKDITLP